MSITFYVQDYLFLTRRQAWGRLFGSCIEKTREAGGHSVEELPTWPGWRHRNGWPSRLAMFPGIRHNSVRWPAPLSAATKR